jgi:glyoxylase-like metal-dependent hydrolase (beta-lactamase superfamily II)
MGEIEELDDGVYQLHYDFLDHNIGVVVGGESVLLIDTRASHRQARELKKDVGRITTLPVEWVVNSHFHWDHTWGNWEFRAGEIWGHEACRRRLVDHGESDKAAVLDRDPGALEEMGLGGMTGEELLAELAETVIVPPEKVFERTASIDIGGRTVELSHFGRGHTDSDIVIAPSNSHVVFAGDLIEEGHPPVYRDAYPMDWPATLRSVSDGGARLAVPGHGRTMSAAFVEGQLEEITRVAELVASVHADEISREEALRDSPYPTGTMEFALARGMRQLDGLPPD